VIDLGVLFAKSINARVTGFIAEPDYSLPSYGELIQSKGESMDAYAARARAHAESALQRIAVRAAAEGVDFDSAFVHSNQPVQAIAAAANQHGCDLIVMVTHGRHGLGKLIHGSVAQDLIAHTRVPVLVLH
jgi:nucleotide-binding universal stress UspA family protein